MKKLKPLHLLLVLCFMLCAGMKCKKDTLDPNGLPKATQTGAMMFACKLNGENWITSNKSRDVGVVLRNDTLIIRGEIANNSVGEIFVIRINKLTTETNYSLNQPGVQFVDYSTTRNCFNQTQGYGYGHSQSTQGEVILTKIDQTNKIISGTFWFDMPTDKCGILKITEGRFDIRY